MIPRLLAAFMILVIAVAGGVFLLHIFVPGVYASVWGWVAAIVIGGVIGALHGYSHSPIP